MITAVASYRLLRTRNGVTRFARVAVAVAIIGAASELLAAHFETHRSHFVPRT